MFDGWFKYTTKFRKWRKWHCFRLRPLRLPSINGLFLFRDWIHDSGLLSPPLCFRSNNRVTQRLLSFRLGTNVTSVYRLINNDTNSTGRHNENFITRVSRTRFVIISIVLTLFLFLFDRKCRLFDRIARVYIGSCEISFRQNLKLIRSGFLESFLTKFM